MKKIIFVFGLILTLNSCGKQCRECKYSTLKGTDGDTFCSSIKSDRIAFEEKWDSIAKYFGSEIKCTKETF